MGTAGLARFLVRGYRRVPAPPPRITAAGGEQDEHPAGFTADCDGGLGQRSGGPTRIVPRSSPHPAQSLSASGCYPRAGCGPPAWRRPPRAGPCGGVGAGARPAPRVSVQAAAAGGWGASAPARLPTFPGTSGRGAGAGRPRPGEAGSGPTLSSSPLRQPLGARRAASGGLGGQLAARHALPHGPAAPLLPRCRQGRAGAAGGLHSVRSPALTDAGC